MRFKEWLKAKESAFATPEAQWAAIHAKGPQAVDQHMRLLQTHAPEEVEGFSHFAKQKDLEKQRQLVALQKMRGPQQVGASRTPPRL